MDCANMGWMHAGGIAFGVLLVVVLVLATAALIKNIFDAPDSSFADEMSDIVSVRIPTPSPFPASVLTLVAGVAGKAAAGSRALKT